MTTPEWMRLHDAIGGELYNRLLLDVQQKMNALRVQSERARVGPERADRADRAEVETTVGLVLDELRRVGVTWARTFGVDVLGNPEHPKDPPVLSNGYSPLLGALDRCAHGRHARDNCFSCPGGGQSAGNLFLEPGTRIGTGLYGDAIVAPDLLERSQIDPWCPISGYHGFK